MFSHLNWYCDIVWRLNIGRFTIDLLILLYYLEYIKIYSFLRLINLFFWDYF